MRNSPSPHLRAPRISDAVSEAPGTRFGTRFARTLFPLGPSPSHPTLHRTTQLTAWLAVGWLFLMLAPAARAIPADPAPSFAATVARATRALADNDLTSAEAAFQQAAEMAPDDPMPLLGLAEVHQRRDQPLEALAAARKATRVAPDDPTAALTTGRLLVRLGASAEALEMLRRARELAPEDPSPFRLEALLLRDLGRHESARDLLTEARTRGLAPPELLEELSLLHLALGETPPALEVARSALTTNPENPGIEAALGLALAATPEHRSEAEGWLRRALEATPTEDKKAGSLQLELGTLLLETGATEEALTLLTAARQSLPGNPESWYRLATALRSAGDPIGARQALERFQTMRREQEDAERLGKELGIELNAVQDLATNNRLDEALARISEVVDRFPTAADGRALRAKILISLGKAEAALGDLAKARQLEPQNAELPFLEGVLLYQLGRPEAAQPPLERAVAIAPSLGQAWALLGVLALQRGQPESAAEAFRSALEAGTDTADVRLAYAEALTELGREEESTEQLEASRRLRREP